MARLPPVLELLARIDGRPVPTMDAVARQLRAGGFLSQSRPGNGAAHVTNDDAANLLLAIMGTDSPAAGPRTVDVYRGLKRRPAPARKDVPRTIGLLVQLPTLGEALEAFLDVADTVRRELAPYGASLEFTVSRPVPCASLALLDHVGRRTVVAEWIVDAERLGGGFYRPEMAQRADKSTATTITEQSLFPLADLIASATARADT